MDALHAVEEIQKNRLLSEVTKILFYLLRSESGGMNIIFAPNLGN